MKKIKAATMLVLFVTIGLMVTQDGFATIYKYMDRDGLINFADDLQSIPAPYRAQAVIVSGEAKDQEIKKPESQVVPKTQLETHAGASAPDQALDHTRSQTVPEVGEKSSFSSRFMFSSIVVVSALFAFIILGIIDADHKKSIKVTRMVILWGMSVFLLYNHAMDVVHFFSSMGKSVVDAQQRSEEKGKKAVKAMKALSNLVEQAENANSAEPAKLDPEKKE
jgi:hypothetical protein